MFETFDIFAIVLFFISFLGLITSRNIIKSIICVLIMQTSVIMFWLFVAAQTGQRPPMVDADDISYLAYLTDFSDPLPQALMLTTIIIGICVIAVNIVMLNTLFRKYETCDWSLMTERAKEDEVERV